MKEALEVGNKTRKQLLDELAAAQSKLNELEEIKSSRQPLDNVAPPGETHFAHLLRDARIANLLFDPNGNLISANAVGPGALSVDEYKRAVRDSLFESAIWTPQTKSRLANGEVLRVRITIDLGNRTAGGPDGQAALLPKGVAHLESTVSSLGQQGYLVQVQDITQEVESKAALRERETFFRSVFQGILTPTLVWRHTGAGNFVLHFFNAAALEASEGRLAQHEGAGLDDFYAREPAFAQRVRECFQTGEPSAVEQEYTFQTTGNKRFLRFTTAKVGHEYVIDSITDLTELKQAQEALVENEARFRRLLDNAPDIVYRLALKPEVHYEYISPAAEAITGFTAEELMSDLQFAARRIHPDDRRQPRELGEIPAVGTPQLLRWIRKDGEVIWLEHRFVVVYEDGEPVAFEGIGREVTAEVEARRVLERSLSEKHLLLQEVHHRVKNNLGILSSLIELQAATVTDPQVREILRDTQSRILSVARVHEALYNAGEDMTHIDLAEYVSRLGAELRDAYAGQGVAIEYELVHFQVSQQRAIHFGLLVNELISNAFKHAFPGTDPGGTGQVQVCLEEVRDCLRLVVRDNGVGLPDNFDPHTSESLGLQVVDLLVEQMEGTVAYVSSPGCGTEVRVEIPTAQLANGR